MATVTGLTAARMLAIEAASVVDGDVVGNDLILTRHDGTPINAGPVVGPIGPQGAQGPPGLMGIPGEVKLWPGATLPNLTAYGRWTWANGDPFDVLTYPIAAGNISPNWKTANGQADPGAGKFRVPDLRGLIPAALDAMPVGSARANRVTRAEALAIAMKTGKELHALSPPEMPIHAHGGTLADRGDGKAGVVEDGGVQHDHGPGSSTNFMAGTGATWTPGYTGPGAVRFLTSATPARTSLASAYSHGHTVPKFGLAIGNAGGDGAHENLQPTIFVPYIVKLDD